MIGCRKKPEGVVLTSDKTSVKLGGEKATLTATVDGKVSYVALYKKGPNAASFTENAGGMPIPTYTYDFDTDTIFTNTTTGVYTFYAEARNCNNSGNKCNPIKSNEISITVTP